jgi:hypothetical protein
VPEEQNSTPPWDAIAATCVANPHGQRRHSHAQEGSERSGTTPNRTQEDASLSRGAFCSEGTERKEGSNIETGMKTLASPCIKAA